jgi:hypothetical protein
MDDGGGVYAVSCVSISWREMYCACCVYAVSSIVMTVVERTIATRSMVHRGRGRVD